MIVRLWGTRGSLASSGPETAGYGGNTAAVEIVSADGTILALDAGTGIRRLGAAIDPAAERVDILLTHLHMDHIQGLGFFAPVLSADGRDPCMGPRLGDDGAADSSHALSLAAALSGPDSRPRRSRRAARRARGASDHRWFRGCCPACHPPRTNGRLPHLCRRGEGCLPARP